MNKEKTTIKNLANSLKRVKTYYNDRIENAKPLKVSEDAVKFLENSAESVYFDRAGLTALIAISEANENYALNVNVPNVLSDHKKITEELLKEHGEAYDIDVAEAKDSFKKLGVEYAGIYDVAVGIVTDTIDSEKELKEKLDDDFVTVETDQTLNGTEGSEKINLDGLKDHLINGLNEFSKGDAVKETEGSEKEDDTQKEDEKINESDTVNDAPISDEVKEDLKNHGLTEDDVQELSKENVSEEDLKEEIGEKEDSNEDENLGDIADGAINETKKDAEKVSDALVDEIDFSQFTISKANKQKLVEYLKSQDMDSLMDSINAKEEVELPTDVGAEIRKYLTAKK